MNEGWAASGAVVAAVWACGVVLVAGFVRARRRPSFEQRITPFLGRPAARTVVGDVSGFAPSVRTFLGPSIRGAADRLDHVLGGTAALRGKLDRAGGATSLEQFRLEQVAWAATGFGAAFGVLALLLVRGATLSAPAAFMMCAAAGAAGVLAREQQLNRAVQRRAERIAAEFPVVAELLALAVAAGEGAAGAIARITRVSSGELPGELRRVLEDSRTGRGLADALQAMALRVDAPAVSRFVETVVIAVERGTPLAEVLRAQAADAREHRRRELMETAGRREIAMLVPVVFLILPITVLFALFPGFYGLSLSVA